MCNRLPTLYRDRHLEGSKTATLYIDLQINIAYRLPFPFQLSITPSLLPSLCIYRASRATFTIKLFMHFHTLQSSQLIYLQVEVILQIYLRRLGNSLLQGSQLQDAFRDVLSHALQQVQQVQQVYRGLPEQVGVLLVYLV